MKKAIIFLGSSSIGALYLKEAVALLDAEPILLLNTKDYSGEPQQAIKQCQHYEVDINSVEDVIAVIQKNNLKKHRRIIGITSFLDEVFPVVFQVAQQLNITGPDPALEKLCDKTEALKLVSEYSPASLEFSTQILTSEMIHSFYAKINHQEIKQYILKPAISSGGVGITIFDTAPDQQQILEHVASFQGVQHLDQTWLLQPRIPGDLYSLEGYVKSGEVFFIGFAKRTRNNLTEVANEYPVDDQIAEVIKQKCQLAVKTLIKRSGYLFGYFHCEFIISEDNCDLIDPNIGRLSGGAFAQHLGWYHHLEPQDILMHVIDLGLYHGHNSVNFTYSVDIGLATNKTLAINYCVKHSGQINHIHLPKDLTSFHTQLVSNGQVALSAGESDSSWVGFLAGEKERVLSEIKKIQIQMSNGEIVSPYYSADKVL